MRYVAHTIADGYIYILRIRTGCRWIFSYRLFFSTCICVKNKTFWGFVLVLLFLLLRFRLFSGFPAPSLALLTDYDHDYTWYQVLKSLDYSGIKHICAYNNYNENANSYSKVRLLFCRERRSTLVFGQPVMLNQNSLTQSLVTEGGGQKGAGGGIAMSSYCLPRSTTMMSSHLDNQLSACIALTWRCVHTCAVPWALISWPTQDQDRVDRVQLWL